MATFVVNSEPRTGLFPTAHVCLGLVETIYFKQITTRAMRVNVRVAGTSTDLKRFFEHRASFVLGVSRLNNDGTSILTPLILVISFKLDYVVEVKKFTLFKF